MTAGSSLADAAADFCQSQHFLLLEPALKTDAEAMLATWAEAVGDEPTGITVRSALEGMARIDVPVEQRRRFPELLLAFLDYLPSTGRFPLASAWATVVEGAAERYRESMRDDGSVRGTTIRKPVAAVGRNDPCPCGSGKKFKKCCGRG